MVLQKPFNIVEEFELVVLEKPLPIIVQSEFEVLQLPPIITFKVPSSIILSCPLS